MAAEPDFSNPLLDALRQLPGPIFATVEGAHFNDATAELKEFGLSGLPLYLEGDSDADVASGPHLVAIRNAYALERLSAMIGDLPAAVFWSWQDGLNALYRHLRTINLIEIPNEDRAAGAPSHETVVFRHADPNVMASILPLLDAAQFSRLIGNAAGLVMNAPERGGLKIAPRPENLPDPARGFLRLSDAQLKGLEAVELDKSRLRVARFLRETAPDETQALQESQMRDLVLAAEARGNELGLQSEHSHFLWAYMYVTTGGRSAEDRRIRAALTRTGVDPDRMMEKVFDAHIDALDDD
jgi:hypothetical protein